MPERIQLKRTKGWRMPPNTVVVARPSKWGNPYIVGESGVATADECVALYREWMCGCCKYPLSRWQRDALREQLHELRGKNLACWCPIGSPCHADVLLEIANS
jgi:hypothetical protein